jgi:hypothetical protein
VFQVIDDKGIMHHLMTHIDRRTKNFQRTLNNFNGTVNAGTKTTGIGKYQFHERDYTEKAKR